MPRYRLTQTNEAAGRDATGNHAEPVTYWVEDYCRNRYASLRARQTLGKCWPCRDGWSNWSGSETLDFYDVPAYRQAAGEGRHIATLERLTP